MDFEVLQLSCMASSASLLFPSQYIALKKIKLIKGVTLKYISLCIISLAWTLPFKNYVTFVQFSLVHLNYYIDDP